MFYYECPKYRGGCGWVSPVIKAGTSYDDLKKIVESG